VNNEVLDRVNEKSNILHTIKNKVKCTGNILPRNFLLKSVIEENIGGEIEGTVTRGRRRKQLQGDLKETGR
jgi:hypothetical protein